MTNPNDPAVQTRILSMVAEVVRGYPVDGVIFDDRMRYAGANADFSPITHAQFETFVGHPVRWPDDVFSYQVAYPSLAKRIVPGPSYDAWLVFRTLTIRNWLASAVATVKAIRPTAQVSVYAGSWYPDYPTLGSNWGADDFSAGLRFLTPSYQKTGFAGLIDWMTTGCYYPPGTVADAIAAGRSAGESVEAAGQFSNRAVNDQTWVYAGIALSNYNGHPELLARALQAATASTQGVMVFDYSHNIDQFWPTFTAAFSTPATPAPGRAGPPGRCPPPARRPQSLRPARPARHPLQRHAGDGAISVTAFVPETDEEAVRCCQAVVQARRSGTIRCGLSRLQPPLDGFSSGLQAVFNGDMTALLDVFSAEHQLEPLGNGWAEVNEETARWVMVRMLSRGLAYRTEIMGEGQARTLTERFLAACARDASGQRYRYFTNGKAVDGPAMYDVHLKPMLGWNPATESTVDTGVVMLTRQTIGLMWAEDED